MNRRPSVMEQEKMHWQRDRIIHHHGPDNGGWRETPPLSYRCW
jgi:hypothetical protein